MSECRKWSRLLRWLEARNCTDFWLSSYTFIDFYLARRWEVNDIWKRKKFGEVLKAFGELTVPKPRKIKLYLSDCHWADFGGEMLRFAEFMKHFSGSLASCRDRPLQITNNVRFHMAYRITDVTRPQTHRVVCLWFHKTPFFKNRLEGLRQDLGILNEMSYHILLSVTYDLKNSWKISNHNKNKNKKS